MSMNADQVAALLRRSDVVRLDRWRVQTLDCLSLTYESRTGDRGTVCLWRDCINIYDVVAPPGGAINPGTRMPLLVLPNFGESQGAFAWNRLLAADNPPRAARDVLLDLAAALEMGRPWWREGPIAGLSALLEPVVALCGVGARAVLTVASPFWHATAAPSPAAARAADFLSAVLDWARPFGTSVITCPWLVVSPRKITLTGPAAPLSGHDRMERIDRVNALASRMKRGLGPLRHGEIDRAVATRLD
jgi:hypothetical protein